MLLFGTIPVLFTHKKSYLAQFIVILICWISALTYGPCRVQASFTFLPLLQRWEQPAQQQGLRIPPLSFESAFSMRIVRVSSFLPDVTQHIHSLRERGVMSCHTALAAGVWIMAFRKSAGILCGRELSFFEVLIDDLGMTILSRESL